MKPIFMIIWKENIEWQSFVALIENFLHSNNTDEIYASVNCIFLLSKLYKASIHKEVFRTCFAKWFDFLYFLSKNMIHETFDEKWWFLLLILKTYSNVLNHGFIDQQISISIAENWICICKIILESQITEDLDTNNFQNNLTNTKCKKVCLKIAYKYFYS